jgi:transposase
VLLSRVYRRDTDSALFDDFVAQLLQHYSTGSERHPVLVMDNASFYRLDRLRQICEEASVTLLYLSLYSPRFNPIEELFAELKAFIKKNWRVFEDALEQGFDLFP